LQDDQPASVPCIIWQHPHLKRYRRQLNPFDTLMQLEIPYKQMRRFGYIRYVQCQVSVREQSLTVILGVNQVCNWGALRRRIVVI
jgi:hypothetical protein